jgi:hypothetical protein
VPTTQEVSICLDGVAIGPPIRHLAFVLDKTPETRT